MLVAQDDRLPILVFFLFAIPFCEEQSLLKVLFAPSLNVTRVYLPGTEGPLVTDTPGNGHPW